MAKDCIIELYSGTLWEAEMIKGLLESAGIVSFVKNNVLQSYAIEPIRSEGVKVMISNNDLESARAIVEDFLSGR